MRRAWYLTGVGSKARDAKEVRVFGLADFIADRFRASTGMRCPPVSPVCGTCTGARVGFVIVFAGLRAALAVIAYDARVTIDLARWRSCCRCWR